MIHITTTQIMAGQIHLPAVIFALLFGLALVMAVSKYLILDIEYPRLGFIQVDAFDQALVDLRGFMK